jgi:cell envelope-related function transcriptional attenuator common domain
MTLVQPAAPVALGQEPPDEIVVLVAEREVAAARVRHPEPTDEHLDRVGDRSARPLDRRHGGRVQPKHLAEPAQLVRVVPVHPHAEPDRLLGLARGVRQDALLAERHELGDPERLDVALGREAEVALDVDLDPQALAVEPVLVALILAEHRVEALVEVLVGPTPGVVDTHRVVGRDRTVEEAPSRAIGILGAQSGERPTVAPPFQDLVLLGDEVGLRADGSEHSASAWGRSSRDKRAARVLDSVGPSILPAMHEPEGARPRGRSPFAAAFLSLIFPGLGQLYAGAPLRALVFAAGPILALALGAGMVLRLDRIALLGFLIDPTVIDAIFVINLGILIYRLVAIVDAYRVAEYLNDSSTSGDGRAGRARIARNSLSIAGLLAVVLVMAGSHVVVARYDMLAKNVLDNGCIFVGDPTKECSLDASSSPGSSATPSQDASGVPTDSPEPDATPVGSALPEVSIPPWDGKERLNILLIGADQRPKDKTFNTDTLIVVSIDPVTKQVAMFSLPRDTANVPIPPGPARQAFGSVYTKKINAWWTSVHLRSDLFRGDPKNGTVGYNGLKAILGNLYGLDVKYFVEVNFDGSKVVDVMGGVTINVQVPVSDDRFPSINGSLRRVYIPSGIQHMDGAEALRYARSRHGSSDFDRGARQQRVLLSLREQADPQDLIPRLPQLVDALGSAVSTDIPSNQIAPLLGLASQIDTKNIRAYVFAPPFYGTDTPPSAPLYFIDPNISKIRAAVLDAFTTDPADEATRQNLAGEGAGVWVLNGTSDGGRGTRLAGYLDYHGLAASAPRQKPAGAVPADTTVVVYNGAEATLPDTIAYLEKTFKVTVTTRTDPAIRTDIVVTVGRSTPDLEAPVGP